jgi:hypothetical protein
MHLNYGQPLNQNKMCSLCQSKSCSKGEYIVNPDDKYRHKWICKTCIVKGTSAYIKKCIAVGTLNSDKEQRARVAPTCPMTCPKLQQGVPTCYAGVPSQKPKESKMR